MIAVCSFVMLGMLGLAVDMGRVFITKNELQTFVDASAMAAVAHLDGSIAGVESAEATAIVGPLGASVPNAYNLDTVQIPATQITPGYATGYSSTYDTYATADSAGTTNQYRFIRITATASVPLNFLPVIKGIPNSISSPCLNRRFFGWRKKLTATF